MKPFFYFLVFILIHGFSIHQANTLFQSNFESEKTLLIKGAAADVHKLYLAENGNLDKWPERKGRAWISCPEHPGPVGFSYTKRKGNILYGVTGIKNNYPNYSELSTASFQGWTDIHREKISLVSPGIHGNGACKIDCQSKGHVMLRKALSQGNEFFGRFYVRFSKEALESFTTRMAWILSININIGIIRDSLTQKPHLCMRFHSNRPPAPKKDIYFIADEPCLPQQDYCLEFRHRGGDSISGGGAFWVDGKLIGSSFTHDTYERRLSNLIFGVFSWARFKKGHFVLDDIVISEKRIGPVPNTPKIMNPKIIGNTLSFDQTADTDLLPKALQVQITDMDGSWYLGRFNSGEILYTRSVLLPAIKMKKDLKARFRTMNGFDNWSSWSVPLSIELSKPDTQSIQALPPSDIIFTLPDRDRKMKEPTPGTWYDVHLKFLPADHLNKAKKIGLYFSHYFHTRTSFLNIGNFEEKYNYFFQLVPKDKTIWFVRYKNKLPTECSGQKCDYIDDSNNQYKVDYNKGLISARIRLSEKAAIGPWTVNAYCMDMTGNISSTLTLPISLVQPSGKGVGLWIVLIIVFIGLCIVIVLAISQRKRFLTDTSTLTEKDYPRTIAEQARDLIGQNLKDPDFTAEKAAKVIGISRNYLSKQFKKETGKSFPEYLNQERLEKAKTLLRDSRFRVSEIAFEVGYNSPEYFNKVFKAAKNLTPSEYRQKFIKK